MNPRHLHFAASASVLTIAMLPWQSALALHSLSAGVQYQVANRYGSTPGGSDSARATDGTISLQVSGSGQQASVSVGYGIFKGSADASVYAPGPNTPQIEMAFNLSSVATGRSDDTWVISGGTGKGYLQFTWTIDGSTSSFSSSATASPGSLYDDAYLTLVAQVDARTGFSSYPVSTRSESGAIHGGSSTYETDKLPFYFDQPLDIFFIGQVWATLGSYGQFPGPRFYSGEAHADFSHTAILSGIQAYDAGGNLLSNVTISAESGTPYAVTSVPEPGSAALLGVGLLTLIGYAWGRGVALRAS